MANHDKHHHLTRYEWRGNIYWCPLCCGWFLRGELSDWGSNLGTTYTELSTRTVFFDNGDDLADKVLQEMNRIFMAIQELEDDEHDLQAYLRSI